MDWIDHHTLVNAGGATQSRLSHGPCAQCGSWHFVVTCAAPAARDFLWQVLTELVEAAQSLPDDEALHNSVVQVGSSLAT